MATLTGVKPGEGWRPVNTIPDHPAVVRIHGFDERIGGMRHIGSGFLIGNIQNRWPVVATAAHVIQEMDKVLGLRPRVPPALDIKEPPSGEVTRQRMDRIRGKIICDVWIPSRGTHAGIGVEAVEVCNDPSRRDTALLFMRLPEPTQLHLLPIDTERAPEAGDNAGSRIWKDRRRAVEVQDRRIEASTEARYNDPGGILRGTPGEYQSDALSSSHCQDSNGRRHERGAGYFSSLTSVLAG
jgi:hypothetical protein